MEDKQRIEVAERHLTNIQGFYPRVDTRVGAIFAISSAQLAITAINISLADFQSRTIITLAVALLAASAIVHASLYLCTFPKLVGGSNTVMFFGHIANLSEADFFQRYRSITSDELHGDLTKQIWRSSQILAAKYFWLKVASISLALSTTCWLGLLLAISLQAGKLPVIK